MVGVIVVALTVTLDEDVVEAPLKVRGDVNLHVEHAGSRIVRGDGVL